MKRLKLYAMTATIAVAMTAGLLGVVSTTATAANAASGSFKDGPYASHSPDSGTCGNNWAVDLMNRNFKVSLPANSDGSYTVVESFNQGHFLTHAGQSPEACGATPTNGTLKAGVSGTFGGSFTINVTNGTFNPNGSCTLDAEGECTTSSWLTGFFGASANHMVTAYSLVYNASATAAPVAHKWTNADTGDIGDIATGTGSAAPSRQQRSNSLL